MDQIRDYLQGLSFEEKISDHNKSSNYLFHFLGVDVDVYLVNAKIYRGVLYTFHLSEESSEIVLRMTRRVNKKGKILKDDNFEIGSTVVISCEDICSITIPKSKMFGQTLATVEASSEINTDCELGSKHSQSSSSHRDLQAIDSAWLLPETQTTFDSTHPQKSAAAKWDQFEVNRRLYNVPDTFDEKFYTKVLDPTTITKEQRDHAEKLAHLIEKTVTNNVHLKEERGQIDETEDEENWNEEDRFSGVIRQADPPSPSPSPESELIHDNGADKVTNQNQTDPGVKRDLQLEIPGDLQEVERQQEEEESVPAPHLPDSSLPRSSSSASLQMLTPSALRATAVEFIPTPTLKQDSQPPKPNLSPRANPPTITALPVSVGKPKGKSRKSKSSPSSSLPSPKSDTSSIISTPEPMASFNTAQSQQFPPFPSQQTMYPQQQPPHPHYQMHPPPQPMYFHPSQQMGYPHMAPFGMPQMGMGMGPPIMFPVPTHGTHYPQFQMPPYAIPAPHPHPQMIPPYGYPPLGPGPPPGSGQYPMPYPFYPPQSFPPHFMPPAPHSHVMDPNVYHHAGVQPNPHNTNTG